VGAAAANPDNTWVLLSPLPERLGSPIFAMAASPTEPQTLLVGTGGGTIYRSGDGGATWREVRHDPGHAVLSLAFNPYQKGVVLAGTRGAGVLRSADGGQTWAVQPGTDRAAARGFAFAKSFTAAGTDQGVLLGREAGGWTPAGLSQLSVSALAVAAANDPTRLVAGADASRGAEPLPLYSSPDGGVTWNEVKGLTTAANMVAVLAAGPVPPRGDTRPLLMGTNTALYQSTDGGQTWQQLTGGGALPATDFTAAAFVAGHPDRYYVASDGGASDRGGLWSTADGGQHFTSLRAPVSAVTALAVTGEEQPTLYVATFRPADHAVMLFSYRDSGGTPNPPNPPLTGARAGAGAANAVAAGPAAPRSVAGWLALLLSGPEAPFLALGAGAAVVILLALAAYITRARWRRL